MFGWLDGILGRREAQQVKRRAMSEYQMISGAKPRFMKQNSQAYAEEGYSQNVVVYACVELISRTLANVDLDVFIGDERQESHPLLDLLKQPNPIQSGADFWQAYAAFRLITGNTYLEMLAPTEGGEPRELWIWPPYQMKVVASDANPIPVAYVWDDGTRKKTWTVEPLTGESDLIHWKTFSALNPWYGMSPIRAASLSVDQHNDAGKWNARLLQNSASPSGLLINEEILSDAEFKQLQQRMDMEHASYANAAQLYARAAIPAAW